VLLYYGVFFTIEIGCVKGVLEHPIVYIIRTMDEKNCNIVQVFGERGRYEIQHYLDKGKFGAVYYGINRYTKHPVAIKIDTQHGTLCHEATVMDFLYRGGCFDIPRICLFGRYDNLTTYLVMDYFPHSLEDYFPNTPVEKNSLMCQMINICCIIHNLGIIHRDIKPKNFMWSTEKHNSIKLIDFGLATVFNMEDVNKPVVKGACQTGNLRFMSPFVKRGETPAKRDDLISVGYIYQYITTARNTEDIRGNRLERFMEVCFSTEGHKTPDYERLKRFFNS